MTEYEPIMNALHSKLLGLDPVYGEDSRFIFEQIKLDWWSVERFEADLTAFYNDRPKLLLSAREQINAGCYKEYYKDPLTLVIYYLLKSRPRRLMDSWPLSYSTLGRYASDIGVSLERYYE